ncbi:hypothetical protein [Sphingomonas abietis]|uniref:Uncharacterized protein n=1 Tax=Sphingomonas abietis TaxID=3012344 RepID=A0ABY7NIU6_9SPHN|nr:hypothetical protein [Sphingomonas abietis]WBO21444.1 hypothetical protein PBT88_14795 [Sphingomonas abietis]
MSVAKRRIVRLGVAMGLALLLAGSAVAAAVKPAKTYPTGPFVVAGHALAATDILDARAIPDMAGKPSLMITLTPAAAAAIGGAAGSKLPCTLDAKPLGTSPADALAADHIVALSGDFGDYDAVSALARRISGRDPLPDSEGDD